MQLYSGVDIACLSGADLSFLAGRASGSTALQRSELDRAANDLADDHDGSRAGRDDLRDPVRIYRGTAADHAERRQR
jgi:hypothetical protein